MSICVSAVLHCYTIKMFECVNLLFCMSLISRCSNMGICISTICIKCNKMDSVLLLFYC